MVKAFISIILPALMLQGCSESVPSISVPMDDIHAEMHVTSPDGKNAFVEVQLKKDGADSDQYLDLEEGDRLIASTQPDFAAVEITHDLFDNISDLSRQYKEMEKGSDTVTFLDFFILKLNFLGSDGIWYYTTFSDMNPDTEVTVAFLRGSSPGATNSLVQLPDAFEITEPILASETVYSRNSDDIVVGWVPSGTSFPMTLEAFTSCADRSEHDEPTVSVEDTGSYTLSAGTLEGYPGVCITTLNLIRSRLGQIDSGYGRGGSIIGHQSRTVIIYSLD